MTSVEKINRSLENGEIIIGVFLDLEKSFDTVYQIILLNKLQAFGIRDCLHGWFQSYLSNILYHYVNVSYIIRVTYNIDTTTYIRVLCINLIY